MQKAISKSRAISKADNGKIAAFMRRLWKFHAANRRDMPWRNTRDPYRILLSELMLQQTQVPRVLQKYDEFLIKFPDLAAVHAASMTDILRVWKGLGYNRRAYFIKKIADILAEGPYGNGKPFDFPARYEDLIKLPGIGQSTGGAIVAFSLAKKTGEKIPYIETNIRSVLMHEFFAAKPMPDMSDKAVAAHAAPEKIQDADILAILSQCLDRVEPADIREFYYALYDYGTDLKARLGRKKTDLHKRSAQYSKQSAFKGSVREMRALILSSLLKEEENGDGKMEKEELFASALRELRVPMSESRIRAERDRFETALERLAKDRSVFIRSADRARLSKSRKRYIIEIC